MMKTISQVTLNFLLNASWQVAFIAAVSSLSSWLLRDTLARYRHLVWVAALMISFALPWISSLKRADFTAPASRSASAATVVIPTELKEADESGSTVKAPARLLERAFTVSSRTGFLALSLYLLFLSYRSAKLIFAWRRTRAIRQSASTAQITPVFADVIERCKAIVGFENLDLGTSPLASVPMTLGIRHPLVILPERLLLDANKDLLITAIGHELAHVQRRDYFWNLLYELLYLPLAFHPAAALIRRRINQTRELSCDEFVTATLLTPEAYARSLVKLAAYALPAGRHATLTLGITIDLLEVRIMSILRKAKSSTRRRNLLLLAASMLLAMPCVATAAFGLGIDINLPDSAIPQTPAKVPTVAIERAEPEYTEDARTNKIEGTVTLRTNVGPDGLVRTVTVIRPLYPSLDRSAVEAMKKWRFEPLIADGQPVSRDLTVDMLFNLSQDQEGARKREKVLRDERQRTAESDEVRARLERELGNEERDLVERAARDPQLKAELDARARHETEERNARLVAHAALARMAKITMEQAIQIANGQYPGKVMECSLIGQGWESLGKLGKDGHALYHVVVMNTDVANPGFTHVFVNALDGTIFRTESEGKNP